MRINRNYFAKQSCFLFDMEDIYIPRSKYKDTQYLRLTKKTHSQEETQEHSLLCDLRKYRSLASAKRLKLGATSKRLRLLNFSLLLSFCWKRKKTGQDQEVGHEHSGAKLSIDKALRLTTFRPINHGHQNFKEQPLGCDSQVSSLATFLLYSIPRLLLSN